MAIYMIDPILGKPMGGVSWEEVFETIYEKNKDKQINLPSIELYRKVEELYKEAEKFFEMEEYKQGRNILYDLMSLVEDARDWVIRSEAYYEYDSEELRTIKGQIEKMVECIDCDTGYCIIEKGYVNFNHNAWKYWMDERGKIDPWLMRVDILYFEAAAHVKKVSEELSMVLFKILGG